MKGRDSAVSGFTLIELLVVMAILGIIMVAVAQVQDSTLKASTAVTGQASQLREVHDASGYLADRLRSAVVIQTDPLLAVNGEPCLITSSTSPCFAALVPEVRQVGVTPQYSANTYLYVAYRMIPRSQVPVVDRRADPWADTNTMTLVEYRRVVCEPEAFPAGAATPGPCTSTTTPSTVPVMLTGMTMNVLLDYATLEDTSGTFVPFAYADAYGTSAALTTTHRVMTLKVRQKRQEGGRVRFTPNAGPLTLTVKQRN